MVSMGSGHSARFVRHAAGQFGSQIAKRKAELTFECCIRNGEMFTQPVGAVRRSEGSVFQGAGNMPAAAGRMPFPPLQQED